MSIADKLDYLEKTKGIIKQSIVDKGQSTTEVFRQFAEAIDAIQGGGGSSSIHIAPGNNPATGMTDIVYHSDTELALEVVDKDITLSIPYTDLRRVDALNFAVKVAPLEKNLKIDLKVTRNLFLNKNGEAAVSYIIPADNLDLIVNTRSRMTYLLNGTHTDSGSWSCNSIFDWFKGSANYKSFAISSDSYISSGSLDSWLQINRRDAAVKYVLYQNIYLDDLACNVCKFRWEGVSHYSASYTDPATRLEWEFYLMENGDAALYMINTPTSYLDGQKSFIGLPIKLPATNNWLSFYRGQKEGNSYWILDYAKYDLSKHVDMSPKVYNTLEEAMADERLTITLFQGQGDSQTVNFTLPWAWQGTTSGLAYGDSYITLAALGDINVNRRDAAVRLCTMKSGSFTSDLKFVCIRWDGGAHYSTYTEESRIIWELWLFSDDCAMVRMVKQNTVYWGNPCSFLGVNMNISAANPYITARKINGKWTLTDGIYIV